MGVLQRQQRGHSAPVHQVRHRLLTAMGCLAEQQWRLRRQQRADVALSLQKLVEQRGHGLHVQPGGQLRRHQWPQFVQDRAPRQALADPGHEQESRAAQQGGEVQLAGVESELHLVEDAWLLLRLVDNRRPHRCRPGARGQLPKGQPILHGVQIQVGERIPGAPGQRGLARLSRPRHDDHPTGSTGGESGMKPTIPLLIRSHRER